MPVTREEGKNGLAKVVLRHPKGSSAEVYLFGATVTSFKTERGDEVLFLSDQAIFDGQSALRGGIPLVFPQFGPGKLPQHGFARNREWTVEHMSGEGEAAPTVVLGLTESEETQSVWKHTFKLSYEVSLLPSSLKTSLKILNTDSKPFKFQALLHTYFNLVGSVEEAKVVGLNGTEFLDKTSGESSTHTETRQEVTFEREVDSVYHRSDDCLEVNRGEGNTVILEKACTFGAAAADQSDEAVSDEDARGLVEVESDVVVWNPWEEKSKKTKDLPDDAYRHFCCVEPGLVREFFDLEAGQEAVLMQRITPLAKANI